MLLAEWRTGSGIRAIRSVAADSAANHDGGRADGGMSLSMFQNLREDQDQYHNYISKLTIGSVAIVYIESNKINNKYSFHY